MSDWAEERARDLFRLCPRCEGNGKLWADGKAHIATHQGATKPCPNCDGEGKAPATAEDIAAALREVAARERKEGRAEGMEEAAEVAWPGLEQFAKELRERAQAIREGE